MSAIDIKPARQLFAAVLCVVAIHSLIAPSGASDSPATSAWTLPDLPRSESIASVSPDPLADQSWVAAALAASARPTLTQPLWAGAEQSVIGERAALYHAVSLLGQGDEQSAEKLLNWIIATSGDAGLRRDAEIVLGELLFRRGDDDAAAERFASALRGAKISSEAGWRVRFWQAATLTRMGQAGAAAETLRVAAAGAPAPDRCHALVWAGWLEIEDGDPAGARDLWRSALGESRSVSQRDSILLDIAESWFDQEGWDSTLAILDSRPVPASSARWEFLRAGARFAKGDFDSAAAAFERMLRMPDANPSWQDEAHAVLGWLALAGGYPTVALAHYSAISADAAAASAETQYGLAISSLQAGDLMRAEQILSAARPGVDDPLFERWMLALACTRFEIGKYPETIAALDDLDPRAVSDSLACAAFTLRGDACYRLSQMGEAYAAYSRAAAHIAAIPELLLRRQALAAFGAGQWGSAARLFGDLILRYPGTAHVAEYHFWRGEAFQKLARFDDARRHYRLAARSGADPASCAYALGWCDYEQERHADAIEQFLDAQRYCSGCSLRPAIAASIGDCLAKLGRPDEAARAYADTSGEARAYAGASAGALASADTNVLADSIIATAADANIALANDADPVQEAAFRQAMDELQQGDYPSAQERFAEVRAAVPDSEIGARALYWEGEALLRQRDQSAAIARLQEFAQHPAASDSLRACARFAIAGALRDLGEDAQADDWHRLAADSPGADPGLVALARRSLIESLIERGEFADARRELAEYSAAAPETEGLDDLCLQLAARCQARLRFEEAVLCYDDCARLLAETDPRRCEVRFDVAECHLALGQSELAASEYESIAEDEACPRRSAALMRAGELSLALGDANRALNFLERRLALDLDPADAARTRVGVARAYAALDQRAAAQNEWEKVASAGAGASDSLRAVANQELGQLAFVGQEWRAALARFTAADSLGASLGDHRARYWAGVSAMQLGDTSSAASWLERYVAAGDSDPVWDASARMSLGQAYETLGLLDDARTQYARVAALVLPGSSLPDEARTRLRSLGPRTEP